MSLKVVYNVHVCYVQQNHALQINVLLLSLSEL